MSTTLPQSPPAAPATGDPLGSLAARLAAADRTLQKERGGVRLLRAWPWAVGFVIGCFVLDVVLHLAGGMRAGLTVTGALLALGFAGWCGWIAFGKRNAFEHTARVLEGRHARLGSKLMNILQLRAQTTDPAVMPMTRELAELAVSSYARELRDEPIEQLARTDALRQEAKRAGYGLLGFAAVLALGFDITRTEVPRFLDPFGDHPPYSFTRLEIADPGDDGVLPAARCGRSGLVAAQSGEDARQPGGVACAGGRNGGEKDRQRVGASAALWSMLRIMLQYLTTLRCNIEMCYGQTFGNVRNVHGPCPIERRYHQGRRRERRCSDAGRHQEICQSPPV